MPVDDGLMDRFLDGDVSDDEKARVVEWLELPANLQCFAKRAELHSDLRCSLRRRSIQERAIETCTGETASAIGSRFTKVGVIALATAASLFFAFMLWPDDAQPDASTGQLATVVSRIDALLTNGEANWDATELVAGEYQLRRGLVHLQFDGGVMVYVEAPAQFSVISGKRLVLQHGRLSANVPPEGIGFTVDTPEAEVVDFGTEFSVDVEGGASEIHVFDGLVRVNPGASNQRDASRSVDLQASQAVRITDGAAELEDISIATARFIRNFDEPRLNYVRAVKRLSPLAHYRMPIRDRGLVSEPPKYSGVLLTGEGKRPPHAQGVFVGGSLRVGVDSTGRGGRVDLPPALSTGQFSLTVFVYLETPAHGAIVATNLDGERGNFGLSLNENGMLQASVRRRNDDVLSVSGGSVLPLKTWRHVVVTADGENLQLYEDGKLVASKPCKALATTDAETVWFGTDARANRVWGGRIDEVALFDRALTEEEVAALYRTAQEEIARSQ
ncbi:FecR protein [Rubripirellula tenax]|uniref:FecR protein n=1 Tax=Rubripirellula tenax TaxID=2528015 RepID=A0A5C6E8D2_9BACT|nr:LamG-like jellyroll fold domain-containing protein [Rubripirellula tenax]TWU44804.1 FecR protein [Rubripirellula tenax]